MEPIRIWGLKQVAETRNSASMTKALVHTREKMCSPVGTTASVINFLILEIICDHHSPSHCGGGEGGKVWGRITKIPLEDISLEYFRSYSGHEVKLNES